MQNELNMLQNDTSGLCISIIGSTHQLSPERRTDPQQLENTINQVKAELQEKYGNTPEVAALLQGIDELYSQIDFNHNGPGIGLFVSQNVKIVIRFFFPVRQRVLTGRSFDIRDLVYQSNYSLPYIVLTLSKKEAKLFTGQLNELTEITDTNFPHLNNAEYEYSKPSRGSSYVGHSFVKEFEKDKSVMEEIRIKQFFKETDGLLKGYKANQVPLITTGESKDLSYFSQITEHNIACNIPGNYITYNPHELGALTWKAMKLHLDNKKEKLINDLREKKGERPAVTGIQNIWKAVMDGRGFKLLVEKDYHRTGYTEINNDYDLWLHPPKEQHNVLSDAVNDLIELMLKKNGEVIFFETDALREYNGMALITRY